MTSVTVRGRKGGAGRLRGGHRRGGWWLLAVGAVGVWLLGLWPTVQAGEGSFSGEAFGDYYLIAAHHVPELEGRSGFWFRRIYFTYDYRHDETFRSRLRLEMNGPGDFQSSRTMNPFVKDAFLQWKKEGTEVLVGLSATPTWNFLESLWGYRSVEKTPLDLQGLGSSRDLGLAVRGTMACFRYHAMAGTGNSNKGETNHTQKFYLGASCGSPSGAGIEFYGDFENNRKGPSRTDAFTLQVFGYWKRGPGRWGVMAARRVEEQGAGTAPTEQEIYSAFGVQKLFDPVHLFARVDRTVFANPKAAKIDYLPQALDASSLLVIAGLDWEAGDKVHFMPNVEYVSYRSTVGAGDPKPDLLGRWTTYYQF